MKRLISLLLIICLCAFLFGCQDKAEPIKKPVTFFYCRSDFDHGNESSVILGETRESAGFENNIMGLLGLYLEGPASDSLRTTIPEGAKLMDYKVEGNTAVLTVTDRFALASGIELTLACACFAKTVLHMTGLEAVKIQAQTVNLGNKPYILMDHSTILLLDNTEIHQ